MGGPREIPTRYLYDARGAALFEKIVRLPEYYQARTETRLLTLHASPLVREIAPDEHIELGVGSGDKTRLLVDAMAELGGSRRVVVQDVHAASATQAAVSLDARHARVRVSAASGDFMRELPDIRTPGLRLWALLGSTFGNLSVSQGRDLLGRIRARSEAGDALLLGVDLAHDRAALLRAYDDAAGVTAAFNLNALTHFNRTEGGDFDVSGFEHVTRFDPRHSRIEMRLRARRSMAVTIESLRMRLRLRAGEELRTEISEKYTERRLVERIRDTGWVMRRFLTDDDRRYALVLLGAAR